MYVVSLLIYMIHIIFNIKKNELQNKLFKEGNCDETVNF